MKTNPLRSGISRLGLILVGLFLLACSGSCALVVCALAEACEYSESAWTWRIDPLPESAEWPQQGGSAGVVTEANSSKSRVDARLVVRNSGPAVALRFSPDGARLHVAHSGESMLRTWSLDTPTSPVTTTSVGLVGLGGASFSGSGSLLALGDGVDWDSRLVNGVKRSIRLWDVDKHALSSAWSQTNTDLVTFRYPSPVNTAVLIAFDGVYVVSSNGLADEVRKGMRQLSTVGIGPTATGGCGYWRPDGTKDGDDNYSALAMDDATDVLAAANAWGQVALFPFGRGKSKCMSEPFAFVSKPAKARGEEPVALAFDRQRRSLARVRGSRLTVWNLQAWGFSPRFDVDLGGAPNVLAGIAFGATGDVVAVASSSGCEVRSVRDGRQLAQFGSRPAYSVDISRAGDRIACGYADGSVDLIAIPKP